MARNRNRNNLQIVEATNPETTNSEANVETTNTETTTEARILPGLTQPNPMLNPSEEQQKRDDAEIDFQIALPKSVVARKFKIKYKQLARERGDKSKAAKRSKWDWLAQQLAELTLTPKAKLDLERFEALMAANGVDTSRWPNRNNGWEGRLRMTAGLVLRKEIAERGDGILMLADGSQRQMPQDELDALIAKFA